MEKEILQILQEIQPAYDFESNSDFIEEGFLDSFDVVQVINELENKFNIKISALDILPENFCSIQAIKNLVMKYINR